MAGVCGLIGGVSGLTGSAGLLLAPGSDGCAAWLLWGGRVVLWGVRRRLRGRRFCRSWFRWFRRFRPAPLTLLGGSLIPFNEFRYRDAARAGGMGRAAGLLCFVGLVGWFGSVMCGRPHPIRLLHGTLLGFGISPAVLGCFLFRLLHIAGDEVPSEIRDDASADGGYGHHRELLQQGIDCRKDLGF